MGRPSDYSEAVADAICERLADGESLRAICADEAMPHRATVFRWLEAHPAFRDQYARAREEQAEALADEIVGIADEECTMVRGSKHPNAKADDDGDLEVAFDATAVARNRLRVEARKWVASKLKPKKYGDRMTHAGDADAPVQLNHSGTLALDPSEAYLRLLNGGN
jgi:hypothetical protein